MKNIVLIITVLLLSACGQALRNSELGTDTGNPFLGTDTGNPNNTNHGAEEIDDEMQVLVGGETQFRNTIETVVCEKLSKCNATLNQNSCFTDVRKLRNLPSAIGFSKATYINLNKIYADKKFNEDNDYNKTNMLNCLNTIIDLKCTDTQVLDAWSTNDAGSFKNVTRVFSVSSDCSAIGK
jgi:hypothetical protein